MNTVLMCADLSVDQLRAAADALGNAGVSSNVRCWIEAYDGWVFDWWRGTQHPVMFYRAGYYPHEQGAGSVLERTLAGRIFSPTGELRWRLMEEPLDAAGLDSPPPAYYRCVYLGDNLQALSDWTDLSSELEQLSRQKDRVLLWGQQTNLASGEWIELRIPHRFRYPIAGTPRGVFLQIERWTDQVGRCHFIRYCNLLPYQE
ncbi:MAG: hypothetical protein KatS3mg110_0249 [Pirellulaceae bacterium]|nr:MAG: hypothetical protein KatS3mg110_0249 [Pirellulaceae bacterium]